MMAPASIRRYNVLMIRRMLFLSLFWRAVLAQAAVFHVATFNLENYLDTPGASRPVKPPEGEAKVRESIIALKADVIALQEMGKTNELHELSAALRAAGQDYPFFEHMTGADTNIHLAILSKFPITSRRPHTNEGFLLSGRRFRVSRGFAEVDIAVHSNYSFTLIAAHLKSKRAVVQADQAEWREEEATILREIIDQRLKDSPNANLVVLGDFNDSKDSPTLKTILGKGKAALFDTRPAERNGDLAGSARASSRNVVWTHYYAKEDSYSRIDYILLSKGMAREWVQSETWVLALPNWGLASDHRPIVAGFVAEDR